MLLVIGDFNIYLNKASDPLSKSTGIVRSVSNLPFFKKKILERVVSLKFSAHLINNNLFEPFQSVLKAGYSTETARIRVVNDILPTIDSNSTSVLLLLDVVLKNWMSNIFLVLNSDKPDQVTVSLDDSVISSVLSTIGILL